MDEERSPTHEHAEKALDDMERRNEDFADKVKQIKEDWERKKGDDKVPGAAGRRQDAHGDDAPEADHPSKG